MDAVNDIAGPVPSGPMPQGSLQDTGTPVPNTTSVPPPTTPYPTAQSQIGPVASGPVPAQQPQQPLNSPTSPPTSTPTAAPTVTSSMGAPLPTTTGGSNAALPTTPAPAPVIPKVLPPAPQPPPKPGDITQADIQAAQAQGKNNLSQVDILQNSSLNAEVDSRAALTQLADDTWNRQQTDFQSALTNYTNAKNAQDAITEQSTEAQRTDTTIAHQSSIFALQQAQQASDQAYNNQIAQQKLNNLNRTMQQETTIAALGGFGSLWANKEVQNTTLENDLQMNQLVFNKNQADSNTAFQITQLNSTYQNDMFKIETNKEDQLQKSYNDYLSYVQTITQDRSKSNTDRQAAITDATDAYKKNVAAINQSAFDTRRDVSKDTRTYVDGLKTQVRAQVDRNRTQTQQNYQQTIDNLSKSPDPLLTTDIQGLAKMESQLGLPLGTTATALNNIKKQLAIAQTNANITLSTEVRGNDTVYISTDRSDPTRPPVIREIATIAGTGGLESKILAAQAGLGFIPYGGTGTSYSGANTGGGYANLSVTDALQRWGTNVGAASAALPADMLNRPVSSLSPSELDTLVHTIATSGEGYGTDPNNRPTRNNNPLDIKVPAGGLAVAQARYNDPGVTIDPIPATDGGYFLKFSSPDVGFNAAKILLTGQGSQASSVSTSGLSIDSVVSKLSPTQQGVAKSNYQRINNTQGPAAADQYLKSLAQNNLSGKDQEDYESADQLSTQLKDILSNPQAVISAIKTPAYVYSQQLLGKIPGAKQDQTLMDMLAKIQIPQALLLHALYGARSQTGNVTKFDQQFISNPTSDSPQTILTKLQNLQNYLGQRKTQILKTATGGIFDSATNNDPLGVLSPNVSNTKNDPLGIL